MNIAVFCASSNQVANPYKQAATILGQWIAQNGHTLVYGGATGGLMDTIAQTVHDNNGFIIGIIPEKLIEKQRKSSLPDQLFIVENMSRRKELIKEYADIFIVLPGGFGTLDEYFDCVASCIVGEHETPIILVNINNYYDGLLAQQQRIYEEKTGFCLPSQQLKTCSTIENCIEILKNNIVKDNSLTIK